MGLKTKILIVDDSEPNIFIVQEILESVKKEYIYEAASTGEEALQILPIFRPDIILLDIMMPGINGYELCKRIRSDNCYKFTKVIMISGKAMLEERLEGYEAGADDYITKPFDDEELLAKIKIFTRLKRSEEVDQIKTNILTLFGHETKTPLNEIFLATQICMDDNSLNDQVKSMLNIIMNASNYLLEFINKALMICDLKTDVSLECIIFTLKEFFESIIMERKSKALKKNIIFYHNCNGSEKINADWGLLHKSFGYLIDNAIKFSPEGGKISILCKLEDDNKWVIRISNQGIGIQPEWRDKIFDEFAIRDVFHHHKGSGLSLAISRLIIENHGGCLELESSSENGSVFRCMIPVLAELREENDI
ncbi:histidine kinase [Candidatus Magnetomoraceae bacterium gMMP-1]